MYFTYYLILGFVYWNSCELLILQGNCPEKDWLLPLRKWDKESYLGHCLVLQWNWIIGFLVLTVLEVTLSLKGALLNARLNCVGLWNKAEMRLCF